jgi:hypothetical protein
VQFNELLRDCRAHPGTAAAGYNNGELFQINSSLILQLENTMVHPAM